VDIKAFVATLRLYWRTFTFAALMVLALGLWWLLAARDQYVSTAQLLVSMQGSTTAEAYQNDDVIEGRISSYISLLSTDVVSQRVIDKLSLSLTPAELSAKISATNVPPKTAIIDIAVTGESPEQARLLAQTVADEFVGYAGALEAATGEGAQKVGTTVVNAASEPHQRRIEQVGLGLLTALAALLIGAIAVWIRSRLDPVVRTPYQASVAARAPVLGKVAQADTPSTEDLDGYRRLWIRLRSLADTDGGRDLEIASPDDTIDTSLVAYNLGLATELGGERTIVLHADAAERSAQLAGAAKGGMPKGQGIEDLERGKGGPDTLQVRWWAHADEDAEQLSSGLIARLRAEYDYVVIAASPGETTSRTYPSSGYAKEVLLVVSLERSKRRDVAGAADSIRETGATLAGLLLVANGGA